MHKGYLVLTASHTIPHPPESVSYLIALCLPWLGQIGLQCDSIVPKKQRRAQQCYKSLPASAGLPRPGLDAGVLPCHRPGAAQVWPAGLERGLRLQRDGPAHLARAPGILPVQGTAAQKAGTPAGARVLALPHTKCRRPTNNKGSAWATAQYPCGSRMDALCIKDFDV